LDELPACQGRGQNRRKLAKKEQVRYQNEVAEFNKKNTNGYLLPTAWDLHLHEMFRIRLSCRWKSARNKYWKLPSCRDYRRRYQEQPWRFHRIVVFRLLLRTWWPLWSAITRIWSYLTTSESKAKGLGLHL
jgi:hypothetical protein